MIYYVQKKEHMDSKGSIHLNFNVTLPQDAIYDMELDKGSQKDRAVLIEYDNVEQCIKIKKLMK